MLSGPNINISLFFWIQPNDKHELVMTARMVDEIMTLKIFRYKFSLGFSNFTDQFELEKEAVR